MGNIPHYSWITFSYDSLGGCLCSLFLPSSSAKLVSVVLEELKKHQMICHGNRFSKNIRFIHEANDGKRIVKSGTLRSSFYVDTLRSSASAERISI